MNPFRRSPLRNRRWVRHPRYIWRKIWRPGFKYAIRICDHKSGKLETIPKAPPGMEFLTHEISHYGACIRHAFVEASDPGKIWINHAEAERLRWARDSIRFVVGTSPVPAHAQS